MQKVRLDSLLSRRGHFESRSRAAASVLAGEIRLSPDGPRVTKPGQLVPEDAELVVEAVPRFVSRGGQKLANAIDELGVDVAGKLCLDAGASTGGFTDCLLQRGAERVVAVDVGYGELHWRIRNDPHVTVLERTNVRDLEPSMLPYEPDFVTVDLSFISLAKVLPALVECMAPRAELLALVKPQFEVGKERVGKGGVVRSPDTRRDALVHAAEAASSLGLQVRGFASSGLPGPKGNRETFLWADRTGPAVDIAEAARRVEP